MKDSASNRLQSIAFGLSVLVALAILLTPVTWISRDLSRDQTMVAGAIACVVVAGAAVLLGLAAMLRARNSRPSANVLPSFVLALVFELVVFAYMGSVVHHYYATGGPRALRIDRSHAAHRLATAIGMYCQDNDGRLPDSGNWRLALREYARWDLSKPYPDVPFYAMNSQLGGVSLNAVVEPERTILLFEAPSSKASGDGVRALPSISKGRGFYVVCVDGTVKPILSSDDLRTLKWSVR